MSTGTHENPDYSLLGEDHVRQYQETDGETGYWWNGAPILLLTTTGRRSGVRRTTPLIFGQDGDEFVIVASVGGMPNHPAWYHNLRADQNVHVQVKAEHFDAVARVADDDDKPRLWKLMNEVWPNYDTYQERTNRVIPVVVLDPVTAGSVRT